MAEGTRAISVRPAGTGGALFLQDLSRRDRRRQRKAAARSAPGDVVEPSTAIIVDIDEPAPPGIAPGFEDISDQWTETGSSPGGVACIRRRHHYGAGGTQRMREDHAIESRGCHGFPDVG